MLQYYDARAPEYDEAYVHGLGSASIVDPALFQSEAKLLEGVVERVARGRLIDIACGTGYWLPHYIERCPWVTLLDQSPGMLAECRKRIGALGVESRCELVRADLFEYPFTAHEFALAGFLASHLDETHEQRLFAALAQVLGRTGRFLILDSAWTPVRARFNSKVERQQRRLNDGTAFEIYKRYLDRDDVVAWEAKYGVKASIEYFGRAFLAVSGAFA